MPEPQPNGSVHQKIHEEIEVVFKAHEKVREEKAHDEQIQKIHEELDALKAEDKDIQEIRKELEALSEKHQETTKDFEIQRERAKIFNSIQQIIVPVLTALVVALFSWVWNSQSKLESAQARVVALNTSVTEIKEALPAF